VLLEERIDVVGIAIARNFSVLDRLEETRYLPRCCATFRVAD
jgi:hypothetical protein